MIKVKQFLSNTTYYENHSRLCPIISTIFYVSSNATVADTKRTLIYMLEQTFQALEIIIVDDGPTPEIYELLLNTVLGNERISYIHNEKTCGIDAIRLNQALSICKGTYISYQFAFANGGWIVDTLFQFYHGSDNYKYDVIFGKIAFFPEGKNAVLIGNSLDYFKIKNGPYISLNGLMHKRELLNTIGLFDCHLSLRKTYEWDFLIRLMEVAKVKDIPDFIGMRKMEFLSNRLSKLEHYCFRHFTSLENRECLKSPNIEEYVIDDLSLFENKLEVYNGTMYDWLLTNRFTIQLKPLIFPKERIEKLLVTKQALASSVDITVLNFIRLLKDEYECVYVPENQLNDEIVNECDYLVLHRTCYHISTNILKKYKGKKPIAYFIDDDLLNIYKLDSVFHYLAPGSYEYVNLTAQLKEADVVVTYSNDITASVQPLNKHIVQLRTNILSQYIEKEQVTVNESKPFEIAYIGGNARKKEIEFFWRDIVQLSQKYKKEVSFIFWGYTPENMEDLKESKVEIAPFSSSYYEYLNRLHAQEFDVVLAPLFEEPAKKAKCPIKLLEACVCNAIGIFSDILPYKEITDGLLGIKIKNEQNELYKAIDYVMANRDKKQKIVANAKNYVKKYYTTEVQINEFTSMLESVKLHGYLGGEGTICYSFHSAYLGGAENHLFRHAMLAKGYGFNVIVTFPTDFASFDLKMQRLCLENSIPIVYVNYVNYIEPYTIDYEKSKKDRIQFKEIVAQHNIKMIHTTTIIPSAQLAANEMAIPLISSLYALKKIDDRLAPRDCLPNYVHSDSLLFANLWNEVLGATTVCMRSPIGNQFFNVTKETYRQKNDLKCGMAGTLQPSKGHHKVIKSVGILNQKGYDITLTIYGYNHFYPNYMEQCKQLIQEYEIEDKIIFKGFCNDMPSEIEKLDIFLCASEWESFPQAVLEAMAMKVPILTTPVTGVPELIINGVSGYVTKDFSEEAITEKFIEIVSDVIERPNKVNEIIEHAFQIAKEDCEEAFIATNLFKLYNKAWTEVRGNNREEGD